MSRKLANNRDFSGRHSSTFFTFSSSTYYHLQSIEILSGGLHFHSQFLQRIICTYSIQNKKLFSSILQIDDLFGFGRIKHIKRDSKCSTNFNIAEKDNFIIS